MTTTIGDRIRSLREFRDLTQEQLATRAEVSVDTIRKLEQNLRQSARINTLRSLARALDVQLERLVSCAGNSIKIYGEALQDLVGVLRPDEGLRVL
ncbi:helix-turn-helix domain-containing protein, partial [Streptomyces sp. NPDC048362]|uniref:helix-turn-helix domain-containing protein n=1 Tax=Streptomyces sp. NPDC048362 TaxID=3365539 RepID=UPI003715DDE1